MRRARAAKPAATLRTLNKGVVMKTSPFASFSILFLLSTVSPALAQTGRPDASTRPSPTTTAPRPTGTTGTTPTGTPSATGTRAADTVISPDYRLGTGDKLRVDIYKDPNLSQSLQIRPDGKITLPLVGDVVALGRTPTELRDAISQSLKQYITEPVVTVIVVETVPQNIYVMGEVNSPGPQPLNGQISVLQALATAGGFRDFAKTKDIRILRKTPKGTETIRFNYNEASKGRGPTMYVQPGDTIIVP
ncbi:MAG: polysaccharide biosynthesis/export family protein [Aldersonia sp.]|nr:polysaccharide biosynthesis/export family protein [Aldersonia sp.]